MRKTPLRINFICLCCGFKGRLWRWQANNHHCKENDHG